MSLTRARTVQYVGILLALGLIAVGYWYFSVRAGVKSNTSATQPQGSGRLDSGLAGYWKLDENTGTSAGDASTNGNSGTLTNGPTWTTGQIKTGVDFDGTDDYITVADPASETLDFCVNTFDSSCAENITLTGWFNRDTFAADHTILAKKNNQTTGIGYVVWIDGTDDRLHVQLYGNNVSESTIASSQTFTATGWHHFAIVIGYNEVDQEGFPLIFIDGVADYYPASGSGYMHYVLDMSNALPFRIGAESDNGNPFDGKIDEVRVYDRMLSADEVAQLYRLTTPTGVDTGLKGYWSFNDVLDDQVADWSGAGNTGTLPGYGYGQTTFAPGRVGQAIDFENDGSLDNFMYAGPVDSLDNATYVSACAWINPESTPSGWGSIITKLWQLEVSSGGAIEVYLPSGLYGGAWDTPNESIPFGVWSHVCFTRDFSLTANAPIIYINGSAVSTVFTDSGYTGLIDNSAYDVFVGAWDSPGVGGQAVDFFDGQIDEARVYNRLLSAAEVKSLYDGSAPDRANTAATQPGGAGLASGLAGYWKLDENTGTSAGDASTNGNSGTLTNGPTWTTGRIGSAVNFDGTNDYITVADPASGVLDAVGDQYYTLSGWFNRDTATTTDTILAKSNGPADTMGYLVYLDATTDKLVFATRSALGDNTLETTSAYTTPGWHHFAIIFNIPRTGGNFGQIYIDSSIQNDNAIVGGYGGSIESTRAFVIGAESDAGNPFDGKLDEIRLYNRALSADEVAQLYRLTMPTGVDTSLKGYWSFNGPDLSGTTAYDGSGAGNHGTLTNGPTKAIGKLGQALNFDGTDDYVDFGNITALNGASQLAVSAWVKHNGLLSAEEHIVDKANCAGAGVFMLYGGETPGKVEFDVYNGGESPMGGASSSRIDDGLWHLVTGTYDGSNVRIYVDGNQENAVSMTGPAYSRTYPVQVGGECDGNNLFWDGAVDEVRLYNRALSANEVKSLYDLGASDKVNSSVSTPQGTGRLDSGLAGYWKLDENTGTSAADTSTNASTGTLTNGPTWTTGRIGSAVTFDGTDDYISVANESLYRFTSDFSLSLWVKVPVTLSVYRGVMGKYTASPSGWDLGIHSNGIPRMTLRGSSNIDTGGVAGPPDIRDDLWHHLSFINTPTGITMYIDGVNRGTTTGTWTSTTNTALVYIGNRDSGTTATFPGSIDEVRIYNRALSADEVGQLYRLTSPTGTDTSLKGYWSFNGPDVSGTTAADRSGAGNNGTLTNGPTKAIGKLGQALSFDGTNDTVSISPTGLPTGSRTISVWAKATLLDGSYRGVIGYGNQNNGEAFAIQINSSNEWVITGWGAPNAVSGGAVVLNQWTHIVGTYSGGNASIYVNGVLVGGPAAITSAPNLNYSAIGSRLDGGGDYFPGQIDEVRIYNRVLSDTEVKALYNSGR